MSARGDAAHDAARRMPAQAPLLASLDHAVLRSSVLWELLALFLHTHFFQAWRLPLWLFAGTSVLRSRLAGAVRLDPAALAYDQQLLAFLAQERKTGRSIVLVSGTDGMDADFAAGIAAHLGVFDAVLAIADVASPGAEARVAQLLETHAGTDFDYVGGARADLALWRRSRIAYSVTRTPFQLADQRQTRRIGDARASRGAALLAALRPRQWLKNVLVFVPMLAGHEVALATTLQSLLAFVAFSLCASSSYLLNDTLDAADDRVHPTKRHRPIAAGALPIPLALGASLLLATGALLLCALLDMALLLVVAAYLVTTIAYSFWLKRILMVDIVTLAILYSMRILGGGAATGIEPSFWLLAFSFFIFLSLALLKRHSELHNLVQMGKEKTSGRGYTTADKGPICIMGINSAFLSVLIFILYVESRSALIQYGTPALLAGIVPLLVFWLGRMWILSHRGLVNEDPVLYVSRDRVSLAVFSLCFALALAATYPF